MKSAYDYQYVHKLFPAFTDTADFTGLAKAWCGPYRGLQIMYTGGVSLARLPQLNSSDPEGIFCGSALTKPADPAGMAAAAGEWISALE